MTRWKHIWRLNHFLLLKCLLLCIFFSYSLFEIITEENKHKHRRPLVVPHTTGRSGRMRLSHSDCPLVVSCVSCTWTWLRPRTTINTRFALHTSYVPFSKGWIVQLNLTLVQSGGRGAHTNKQQKEGDFLVVQHSWQSPGCNYFPVFWMYCTTSRKISP